MKLKPEGCKLIVEADRVKEKTESGIYLAPKGVESEQMRITKGTIVAIGPAVDLLFDGDRKPAVGDRIMFARYGGMNLSLDDDDRDYRVLNDEDVLCLIEDK